MNSINISNPAIGITYDCTICFESFDPNEPTAYLPPFDGCPQHPPRFKQVGLERVLENPGQICCIRCVRAVVDQRLESSIQSRTRDLCSSAELGDPEIILKNRKIAQRELEGELTYNCPVPDCCAGFKVSDVAYQRLNHLGAQYVDQVAKQDEEDEAACLKMEEQQKLATERIQQQEEQQPLRRAQRIYTNLKVSVVTITAVALFALSLYTSHRLFKAAAEGVAGVPLSQIPQAIKDNAQNYQLVKKLQAAVRLYVFGVLGGGFGLGGAITFIGAGSVNNTLENWRNGAEERIARRLA